MSGLVSFLRLSKGRVAALAALLLLAALLPWGTVSALATPPLTPTLPTGVPLAFEGGDGNMAVDNGTGTSGGLPDYLDWASPYVHDSAAFVDLPDSHTICGSQDDIFSATKEDDLTTTVACQPTPPKVDLHRMYAWTQTVDVDNAPHTFLYLAWEAPIQNGANNNHIDFELNQQRQDAPPTGGGTWTLKRAQGDLLFDFNVTPSSPTVSLSTWDATNKVWTAETTLGGALAAVNSTSFTDAWHGDTQVAGSFGEAAIDMTGAGLFSSDVCTNYSDIWAKGRSSGQSDQSEMKDFIAPTNVAVSNCGTLRIDKYADDGKTPVPGATFTVTPNPKTGTGSLQVTEGQTGDDDNTADGVVTITDALPGTYQVEETTPPPGYLLPTSDNPQSGVSVTKGEVTDVSFVDRAIVTSLSLKKSTTTSSYAAPGDTISYRYVATNDGNVPLTPPYAVADNKTSVTCDETPDPLAPGASFTCTASYTVTQADVDAGSVTNLATASATYGESTVRSNQDSVTVQAAQDPKLTLKKSSPNGSYNTVGQVLVYDYLLTNAGNVTLAAPYTVSDDKSSTEQCPASPSTLAPGASVTCTATYTVTQADLDAGSVTNHAVATAHFGDATVTSNPDQLTIQAAQGPALSLDKTPTEATYDAVGQVLHYTYTLTNTGNTTLTAPYAVADDRIAAVDCSAATSPLPVGASTACTATYTVTQADLDAGSVTNLATATARSGAATVTSNQAKALVDAVPHPGLVLVKSVDKSSARYGDTLTYTLKATNTGNVALDGVVVTDVVPTGTTYVDGSAKPGAAYDAGTTTVSWTIGRLAAGASVDGLTFQVSVVAPTYDPAVGLPAETIDNVGNVAATGVEPAPSNEVSTPVTEVLAVKVVKPVKPVAPEKPAVKPSTSPHVLPFTGLSLPLGATVWTALTLLGAGIVLTTVRRRRAG